MNSLAAWLCTLRLLGTRGGARESAEAETRCPQGTPCPPDIMARSFHFLPALEVGRWGDRERIRRGSHGAIESQRREEEGMSLKYMSRRCLWLRTIFLSVPLDPGQLRKHFSADCLRRKFFDFFTFIREP